MASSTRRQNQKALADLIESLGSTSEGKLFARDVVEEYPQFAEQYKQMCPERTDLTAMRKKAMEGQYGMSADAVLRDVALMVDNCCRFNGGPQTEFGITALKFQSVAKAAITKHFASVAATAPTSASSTQPGSGTPVAVSEASASSSTASKHHSLSLRPKRGRAEGDDASATASASATAPEPKFTTSQLLQFIASLERPEDGKVFSRDAVQMFPEIAADYDRVCPVRMDLDRMRAKARASAYSTVEALRRDIVLIKDNCVTYNGPGTPVGVRAEDFCKYAEQCLKRFAEHPAEYQQQAGGHVERGGVKSQRVVGAPSATTRGSAVAPPPKTTATHHQTDGASSNSVAAPAVVAPPPREKEFVTPAVRPLSFQLPLHIPPKLRSRLLTAHLQKDSWPCKILPTAGHACSVDAVVHAFLQALRQQVEGLDRDAALQVAEARVPPSQQSSDARVAVKDADGVPPLKREDPSNGDGGATTTTPPLSTTSSANVAESALRRATLAVATAAKRREHAAHCADVMRILVQLFNDVFLQALLYHTERCTVDAWVAKRAPSLPTAAEGSEAMLLGAPVVVWSSVIHVEYLIRLAVHLPQLGCLAAAQSAQPSALGATSAAAHPGTALLSTRQLKETSISASTQHLVATTLPPIEALLCFVEAHYSQLFHSDGGV